MMSDGHDRTLLEFPCEFPIKIMGRDEENFRRRAVELIEAHAGAVPQEAISTSTSRKGTFVSITVTITAESQEQLDRIYHALSAHEEVLVAL